MAASIEDGYDFQFVDALSDRLVCRICHNPCRDAHLTGCCGAHFCLSCLRQLKKGTAVNKACPMCREEKFKIFPNKQLDREIKALHVYCVNGRSGCTWSGEINEVEKHLSVDCQFVDVLCPSKCGMKLKRQCVPLHLAKECPCHCQHCGTTGSKEEITKKHKEHCVLYPLPCPNGCEMGVVPSSKMNDHKKVCPLELVHCKYYNIGCKDLIVRRDIKDHHTQAMAKHLDLMNYVFANVAGNMDRMEQKLTTVEQQLENRMKNSEDLGQNYAIKAKLTSIETRISNINTKINKNKQFCANTDLVYATEFAEEKCKLFEGRFTRLFVIVFLCCLVYCVQVKSVNNRLLLGEQYTWPKMLNRLSRSTSDSNEIPVAPVIFKVPEYTEKLENNEAWHSTSFLAFENGYTVWLTVGFAKGKGIFVTLSFERSNLKQKGFWPLRTMFKLEMLNQLCNDNHFSKPFLVDTSQCSMVDNTKQCTTGLVSTDFLGKSYDRYLKDDEVYLRISHDTSIYNYIEWYIQEYFNRSLSIPVAMVIAILLVLEIQETVSMYLGYYNEIIASGISIVFTFLVYYLIIYSTDIFTALY